MFMDYISAVLLIFFAEMGDKTQFLAMAFATKYPVRKILLGVAIGAFLNHGLAMVLGRALLQLMPGDLISFIAGLMFIFFAFKSLEIDDEDVEESTSKYGPVLTVALAFFLGELGDKTQLSALGLSVDAQYMWLALLGTTTGMVITSSLGIFVGLKLGKKIPEDKLKLSAFTMFMIFGLQKVQSSYLGRLEVLYQVVLVTAVILVALYVSMRFLKRYKTVQETAFVRQAERLKKTKERIEFKIADMCRGTEHCGVCDGRECLVGYMRSTLKGERPITDLEGQRISQLKNKSFNKEEAKAILHYLMEYYEYHPSEFKDNVLLRSVRHTAEFILMNKMISTEVYEDYQREIKKYM